jgi:hypothetical protein
MNWKPLETAPTDTLIAVSGHIFGDKKCSRFYIFAKKRKMPDSTGIYHFYDTLTGDYLDAEQLTHFMLIDEVPE